MKKNSKTTAHSRDPYLELLDAYDALAEDYLELVQSVYDDLGKKKKRSSMFTSRTDNSRQSGAYRAWLKAISKNGLLKVENAFLRRRPRKTWKMSALEDETVRYYAARLKDCDPKERDHLKALVYKHMLDLAEIPTEEILERAGDDDD